MKLNRAGHKLFYCDGNVYAIGGNNDAKYHNECEVYNIKTKTWSDIDSL